MMSPLWGVCQKLLSWPRFTWKSLLLDYCVTSWPGAWRGGSVQVVLNAHLVLEVDAKPPKEKCQWFWPMMKSWPASFQTAAWMSFLSFYGKFDSGPWSIINFNRGIQISNCKPLNQQPTPFFPHSYMCHRNPLQIAKADQHGAAGMGSMAKLFQMYVYLRLWFYYLFFWKLTISLLYIVIRSLDVFV